MVSVSSRGCERQHPQQRPLHLLLLLLQPTRHLQLLPAAAPASCCCACCLRPPPRWGGNSMTNTLCMCVDLKVVDITRAFRILYFASGKRTSREKGSLRISRSVDFWYFRISCSARVPGRYRRLPVGVWAGPPGESARQAVCSSAGAALSAAAAFAAAGECLLVLQPPAEHPGCAEHVTTAAGSILGTAPR